MTRLALVLGLLAACATPRATREDCEHILERIVDIELKERGYKDPMLQTIKRSTLKRKLAQDLDRCVGKKLKTNAIRCVDAASSIEALTHDCFGS